MSRESEERALTFATGLVLGGLLGAGVALLVAPRSGERTRKKLRHAAEDLGDEAEEKVQHMAEDARRYAERARKKAERSGERVKDSVERGRERLKI